MDFNICIRSAGRYVEGKYIGRSGIGRLEVFISRRLINSIEKWV